MSIAKQKNNSRFKGFTVVELTIAIAVIAILALVTIVGFGSWRSNIAKNEAQSDLKQLASLFESAKNFGSGYPTSIPASFKGSPNLTVTYTGDATKYCIEARSKADGSVVYNVSNTSKEPQIGSCVRACDPGDALSGSTCTSTYAATYEPAGYTCSSGTLNGTNCVDTYNASYSNGSYYCSNGDTLSGSNCSYAASSSTSSWWSSQYEYQVRNETYWYGPFSGPSADSSSQAITNCRTHVNQQMSSGNYTAWRGCTTGTYNSSTTYSCPRNSATRSGTTCAYGASYNNAGYYCPSGGTLSGTTCTRTVAASNSPARYTCPNGGTLSGSTCTKTYPART